MTKAITKPPIKTPRPPQIEPTHTEAANSALTATIKTTNAWECFMLMKDGKAPCRLGLGCFDALDQLA